jgi:urease accessory protein
MKRPLLASLFPAATLAWSGAAFAHPGHGAFLAGLAHPLLGADHLLAMVAVGFLGARFAGGARWALPAAFVAAMLAGALLGVAGVSLPAVEPMVALSVLALGLAIACALRFPPAAGAAAVAVFALFHGHAHFAGQPSGAPFAAFAAGMLIATALLHAAGIVLALRIVRERVWLSRLLGGALALAGAWMAFA